MNVRNRLLISLIVACIIGIPCTFVLGGMQSSTYKINFDAVDTAGVRSSSGSYNAEDTLGETATGNSSSANYTMKAGYQQMYTSSIAISSPSDVSLPAISGLTGGISTSSLVWTVTTDNSAGYALYVQASTAPALKALTGGGFFTDYTPAGSDPDFTFSISPTVSAFGFSPEGTDIVSRFKDNGSTCNTGSSDTANACWDKFATSDTTISQSTGSNHPIGTATTLKIRAEIGSSKIQDNGTYSATITATAIAL